MVSEFTASELCYFKSYLNTHVYNWKNNLKIMASRTAEFEPLTIVFGKQLIIFIYDPDSNVFPETESSD